MTERGGYRATYDYDVLNRLETETWVDGLSAYGGPGDFVIRYGYDAESNLTGVRDPLSSLALTYDALGRVETETQQSVPGVPDVTLVFGHDEVGNRTSVSEQIGGVAGAVTSYAYDAADRVQSITQSLATGGPAGSVSEKRVDFAYNEVDQFASITRFADRTATQPVITTTYAYDTLNRLTDLRHRDPSDADVAFYTFDYDQENRLTRIVDIRGTIDYRYDGRGQLTGADYADVRPDETYGFDPNGNRVASSRHGDAYETGDSNRLLSDGRYSYDYNDRGDLILRTDGVTGETRAFTWDHRSRLARVDDLTAAGVIRQSVSYAHDGLDRRITRSVDPDGPGPQPARQEAFVYDGQDVLLDFVDGDLAARYLHGPAVDQVLAREDFTAASDGQVDEVRWHLHDQLGSTREIIDSTGTIVNQITLDAFGSVVDQTDPAISTRYLFTGREYDEATNLYYYRARFYDPQTGRFISEDPIGFTGDDWNLYRYVRNQTTGAVDPTGLVLVAFDGTGNSTIQQDRGVTTKTNVLIFKQRYRGDAYYQSGVGVRTTDYFGKGFGKGAKSKVNNAVKWTKSYFVSNPKAERVLDVVGFSRRR